MDAFYFYGSKIAWLILNPLNLVFLALALGTYFLWTKRLILGRRLVAFGVIVIGLVGLLPVDQWLMRPLEDAYQQPDLTHYPKIDGILVLGGEFNTRLSEDRAQVIAVSGTERINAFIDLMRKYPEAKAIFSGGSPALRQGISEASITEQYFQMLGVDMSKIVFEDLARNTRENAIYLKKIVNPQPDENWVLITSAYHMPRSMKEFKKLNWTPIPYPVGYRTPKETEFFTGDVRLTINNFITAIREWLATLRP